VGRGMGFSNPPHDCESRLNLPIKVKNKRKITSLTPIPKRIDFIAQYYLLRLLFAKVGF
jgi:hypothetical protein